MSLFRWSSEHDVFLPEVDAEHRALFLAGDHLHRALLAGAPPENIRESLHNLLQLVEAHFRHEERLMVESEFSSYEWHRKQHDAVRSKAKGLKRADRAAMVAALEFIAGWLRDHTSVADRIMASHVRNWTRRMAA
jgi:hemerythrin-like metal-binding protein